MLTELFPDSSLNGFSKTCESPLLLNLFGHTHVTHVLSMSSLKYMNQLKFKVSLRFREMFYIYLITIDECYET